MKALGIRIDFLKQKWPDLLKMGRAGQLQMWPVGWINDVRRGRRVHAAAVRQQHRPDRTTRASATPSTTTLYRKSQARCPTGPSATRSTGRMAEIVAAYNPWDLGVYSIENTLVRPWVLGYKKHVYREHAWKYLDLDDASSAPRRDVRALSGVRRAASSRSSRARDVAPPPQSPRSRVATRRFALPHAPRRRYDGAITRESPEPRLHDPIRRTCPSPRRIVAGGAFARAARPWSGRLVTAAPHSQS